jgi:hypothetical protein
LNLVKEWAMIVAGTLAAVKTQRLEDRAAAVGSRSNMYWDVVEVKPEPGYRLFVRFRDGRAGHVQLQKEELTGVLSPLLDEQFFERVSIDCGAVAWPGEIDLAPDAMYAQLAGRCDESRDGGLRHS